MYRYMWYDTQLPERFCDEIRNVLEENEVRLQSSRTLGEESSHIRDSDNYWIPDSHWINSFCSHYINLANRENFKYDIYPGYQNNVIQYSLYKENKFYGWHTDTIHDDKDESRKLSFSLQLSNYDEYTGGDLQMIDEENEMYIGPKSRGSIIIFDSRLRHRVRKVTSGERRSLVGWVMGPRWK